MRRSRRVVRRIVTRRAPLARLAARRRRPVRRRGAVGSAAVDERAEAEPCGASGWHLRVGCTDGNGVTICPLCGQPVRTHPDLAVPRPVRVIQEHCA